MSTLAVEVARGCDVLAALATAGQAAALTFTEILAAVEDCRRKRPFPAGARPSDGADGLCSTLGLLFKYQFIEEGEQNEHGLATSRRKIDILGRVVKSAQHGKTRRR